MEDRHDSLSRCMLAIRFLSDEHLNLLAESIKLEETRRLRHKREAALAEGRLLGTEEFDTGYPRHVLTEVLWHLHYARGTTAKTLCGHTLTAVPVLVVEGEMWGSAPKAVGTVTCPFCVDIRANPQDTRPVYGWDCGVSSHGNPCRQEH